MAKGIIKNYTFNTSTKAITLTDITTVRLDKIALITDVTTNKILYNFADNTLSTATVATNVITLSVLQGGEANGDKLRIDYDIESSDTSAFADTIQPTTVSSLPLPSGAATSAKQDTGNTSLSSIDSKIVHVDTGAVVVSSSVLPTGAATSTKQSDGTQKTQVVDGSGNVQPSGDTSGRSIHTTVDNASLAITAASLPLPSTASTSTKQSDGSQKTQVVDGSGNVVGSTGNAIDVNIKSGNAASIIANAGTNLNTSALALDATLTGGTQKSKLVDSGGTNAASVSAGGALKVDNSGVTQPVSGAATGSAVPAGAFYEGYQAKTSLPTAVTDGQLVGVMSDKFGRQVVIPNGMRDLILPMTRLTITADTSEKSLIAAVASTFNDLLSIVVVNSGASATLVDFRDSTGGTIRLSLYVPAGDVRGIVLNTPLPQNAVNTAWTAQCTTSTSSIIITGTYITNK